MLQKGLDPYEYMDNGGKFSEKQLPENEDIYSSLNMEDIADTDYRSTKRVWKDFEIKNLGKYHHLYVWSNTVLLVDVFKNFQNTCLEIFELDPGYFLLCQD